MADQRRPFPFRLTDEAREGYRLFANAHGVTVTGLLEALGVALHDVDTPPPFLRSTIAAARALDGERRAR